MRNGPNTKTCLDVEADDPNHPLHEARTVHARENTGLDIVDGVLCSTRRCVWCGLREHKAYGSKTTNWKRTRPTRGEVLAAGDGQ